MLGIDSSKIDWKLLRKQKLTLTKLLYEREQELNTVEKESLDAIIHLLDAIQDEVVESGDYTEKEIFGDMDGIVERHGDDRCIVDMKNEQFIIFYNKKKYLLPFVDGDMAFENDEIQWADYWGEVGVKTKGLKDGSIDPTLKDINIGYDLREGGDFNTDFITCGLYNLRKEGENYTDCGECKTLPVIFIDRNDKENTQ